MIRVFTNGTTVLKAIQFLPTPGGFEALKEFRGPAFVTVYAQGSDTSKWRANFRCGDTGIEFGHIFSIIPGDWVVLTAKGLFFPMGCNTLEHLYDEVKDAASIKETCDSVKVLVRTPTAYDALLFLPSENSLQDVREFCGDAFQESFGVTKPANGPWTIYLRTSSGTGAGRENYVAVTSGDWILRETAQGGGGFFTGSPDFIREHYSEVEIRNGPCAGLWAAPCKCEPTQPSPSPAPAPAPKITLCHVTSVIAGATYHVPEGTTLTVCVLTLKNGYTVTGESACISPENFDPAIGEVYARSNAIDKIWALEGYLLEEKLYQEKLHKG